MHDLLSAIVASARTSAAWRRDSVPAATLERLAASRTPGGDLFAERLSAAGVNVIAECKRRSPAKGVLQRVYDPAVIARVYAAAGAAAISVLTEPAFFDGDLAHLREVRAAVATPVLRKDFIVDPYQVLEARAYGADAVLLIAAALADEELRKLMRLAADLGLAALVEVHDRSELVRAVDAGASLIGVNSRNLKTLRVDTGAFLALAPDIPRDVVAVAESGLSTAADVRGLRAAGYRGFLIGEWLMRSAHPGKTLAGLIREAA